MMLDPKNNPKKIFFIDKSNLKNSFHNKENETRTKYSKTTKNMD
jgi:hypothetical protein